MKFYISKSALLDALTITGKCIGKSILPIMECYLFRIENNKLTVIGGNLEVYLEKTIDIEAKDLKIEIAIPAHRLFCLVKELVNQPLEFVIGEGTITLRADCGNYVIPFYPGADYSVQKNKEEIKFEMLGEDLLAGIGKTIFAASPDLLRPAMAGVLISFSDHLVTYTATNANILSTYSYEVPFNSEKSFIVPVKVLSILQGLVPNTRIGIKIDDKSIVFEVNNSTVLKSRLIDEKYPDYRAIIPKTNDKVMNAGRWELLASLKRVTQFPDDAQNTIKFRISDQSLAISSENALGEFASEKMAVEYAGEEVIANFNGKNLIACLSNLTAEQISISFKSPKKAFLVRSDEAPEDELTNLMLLMPIG